MALNPIAFTEQVVADFLRYQLTTYPLADTDLYGQLRALLQLEETRRTPLRRGPFVSLSRPFKTGATVAGLIADGVLHPAMAQVVPYPAVRAHQEKAIRAIHRGETTLVATGTGSGKTESFLYPIISRCLELQEAGAPPGIVAVLIYPMNALAEDQLDRIRGLLAGRGVPFGMYVGKTPDEEAQVRGERMPAGSSNAAYHARLQQIREAGQAISLLPPEERASRAAMRKDGGQPRILLTNVKQLELLLTRGKDIALFEGAPLEFLVFDEAHTFRGAQGAETACLIRRLRTFCGKAADEVTCVATSATMADPHRGEDAGRDFARRFFGVDPARVTLVGEVYDDLRWNDLRSVPEVPDADPLALLSRLLRAVDLPDGEVADELSACTVALGGARLRRDAWQVSLASQLASNELVYGIAERLRKPAALADLAAALTADVGRPVSEAEILCWLALGAATGRGDHDPLLRPVVHSFIRGVGGAVVTFAGGRARLWLGGEDADEELGDDFRRFPVLTCTTCGQHYYETAVEDFALDAGSKKGPRGGELTDAGTVWEAVPSAQGGCRVVFVDRLVVRPDEDAEDEDAAEDTADHAVEAAATEREAASGHDYEHRRLYPLWVCGHCGALSDADHPACPACHVTGALVAVQVVRTRKEMPGVLHACVACQAPGRRPAGGRYREPARPVRAVGVSDVHVLAQSMVHLSERPRLLVFADNRQDAAFQAGWMRDHARRFRLRALLMQQVNAGGVAVGDVAQGLDALLESDRELSRALIPEVWQFVPQEDAGVKHREERLYYLRLQVLREIATGVKQRLGLEPWGRLRVSYVGLHPDLPFVQAWAPRLRVSPEALTEGIAALLDHHRRIRVLHDAPTRIFGKQWNSGEKEVQFGYLPAFAGGPKGVKLSRAPEDLPARVTQWVGTRPTQVWNAVRAWGVPELEVADFLDELWAALRQAKLLVPVTLEGWGRPLKGSAGTWQIDAGKLALHTHQGRWRCTKCRRTSIRRGPTGVCMAWRCGGALIAEVTDPDDFDLHVLDGNYDMLRVAEHSAQVPHALRERYENQFKGKGEQLNTLVCTPTLELGVDIGALDAVLMRNVPPTAANYWQRAGRAGRRHRMAVDITYAQATGFDQAYFREPLKLLGGLVEPPRFNLKNELMVRKHVHATVLTTLYGLARRGGDAGLRIQEALTRCFPSRLTPYLFSPGGEVLPEPLDVASLGAVVAAHRAVILAAVERAFVGAWPAEDVDAVAPEKLGRIIDDMVRQLADVLRRFKRRLDWARGELSRLAQEEARKGVLDPEDQAHRRRCQRVIERFKSAAQRARSDAQGGPDDADTMGALAREGFLPGYGLESGSIIGSAEPPRQTEGLGTFDLPRAPTLALREYVPGNAIYANGFRFVPRRFQLTPDDTLRFRVVAEQQVVQEMGVASGTTSLGATELRAVPVCDAILPSQSQISDEEEFRFQMPVAVYGLDRGFHRGGAAWRWSGLDLQFRRGVALRLVNVGPRAEVAKGATGYPLCLACGQSLSPFASSEARKKFDEKHAERCNHVVQPTGFYADVEVDVLGLHDVEDRHTAFSLVEALRMGAARVLDMEVEDLHVLAIGHEGEAKVDMLLYDPMPGGSGLLEQLVQRWEEVRQAAIALVDGCPGACLRSCIDCLQTYRNRFYHEHLDRHRASELLRAATGGLVADHDIPEKLPKTSTTVGQPQTWIEARFRSLLLAAGLPEPRCQEHIDLGAGFGHTIPDFFYTGEDDDEPGVCIYLDGMAGHIHGNPAQADRDRFLRERLRSLGYEVIVVTSTDLDDRIAVVAAIAKVAKYLVGKDRWRALRDDTSWFDAARPPDAAAPPRRPHLRLVWTREKTTSTVPVYDLKVAAGAFSDGQAPEVVGFAALAEGAVKPGWFLAKVVGDSMDRLAPPGSWCVWQHLGAEGVAAIAPGEAVIVRRPDGEDPELGEFTFKRLVEDEGGRRVLQPVSSNPSHVAIPIGGAGELVAVARFVGVAEVGGAG